MFTYQINIKRLTDDRWLLKFYQNNELIDAQEWQTIRKARQILKWAAGPFRRIEWSRIIEGESLTVYLTDVPPTVWLDEECFKRRFPQPMTRP